ncbi:MAG: DUF1127 domain-containing protein [Kiloniellales bacterium]
MSVLSMAVHEILTTGTASQVLRGLCRALVRPARRTAARGLWRERALSASPGHAWNRRARANRQLPANLSDHLLADIGVSRAEIAAASSVGAGRRV